MAIKRVTIEIDDQVENLYNPTDMPKELKHEQTIFPKQEIQTGELSFEESTKVEQDSKFSKRLSSKKTGRTYSDLFVEIKEDPRSIITFFTIISFAIFSLQISKLTLTNFLIYSFITSGIFNFVWFITPWIIRFFKKTPNNSIRRT